MTPPGCAARALPVWRRAGSRVLAAALTLGLMAATVAPAVARTAENPALTDTVSLATLPPEARRTHRLILAGGPFPYSKDGTVFFNRERLLPPRPRGQYREYTVRTPGASNRGARRIVCGGRPAAQPQACWYTADHYSSFRLIQP